MPNSPDDISRSLCVHCLTRLGDEGHLFRYPRSGYVAHHPCVSGPSFPETDALLLSSPQPRGTLRLATE